VRERTLERDRHRCTICGSADELEAHHVIAAEDGGPTALENLITLCSTCHDEIEAVEAG
jgi:5-methylcytosine-specific restriction endonuclease McrA